MKILLSTLSALLLLGCSADEQKTAPKETASAEPVKTEVAAEASLPKPAEAPVTAEAPKPVETAAAPQETTVVQPPKPAPAMDGATLFKHKCATCHGQNAEKHALNASQIIAGWEKAKVLEALHGYRAGSYGGTMKGMMQGQVKALSDAEMEALAGYIQTLGGAE